jgi:hypothetical protein
MAVGVALVDSHLNVNAASPVLQLLVAYYVVCRPFSESRVAIRALIVFRKIFDYFLPITRMFHLFANRHDMTPKLPVCAINHFLETKKPSVSRTCPTEILHRPLDWLCSIANLSVLSRLDIDSLRGGYVKLAENSAAAGGRTSRTKSNTLDFSTFE